MPMQIFAQAKTAVGRGSCKYQACFPQKTRRGSYYKLLRVIKVVAGVGFEPTTFRL